MRILVIANESVLADAIVSTLDKENDLVVLRATQNETDKIDQAVRENCQVVIFVEEGISEENVFMPVNLFNSYNNLRALILSPEKPYVRVYENYHVSISGMEQMVGLVRGSVNFKREG